VRPPVTAVASKCWNTAPRGDSRAGESRDAPSKPQRPTGRFLRTASLPYRMHNRIKILGMNLKWYQPEPWVLVEQRERFAK